MSLKYKLTVEGKYNVEIGSSYKEKVSKYDAKTLEKKLDFLSDIAREIDTDLEKLLRFNPRIISKEENEVQENIKYVKEICDNYQIDYIETIKKSRFNLLVTKTSTINETMEYLQSIGLNVEYLWDYYPRIFTLKKSNVKSKVEYLTKEVGISIQTIEIYPFFLGHSLNKRIKPRWEKLKEIDCVKRVLNEDQLFWLLTNANDRLFESHERELRKLSNAPAGI